jgi:hypothetical protein
MGTILSEFEKAAIRMERQRTHRRAFRSELHAAELADGGHKQEDRLLRSHKDFKN